jgi:hypothetical protein
MRKVEGCASRQPVVHIWTAWQSNLLTVKITSRNFGMQHAPGYLPHTFPLGAYRGGV